MTTFLVGTICLLTGYGAGLRVASHYWRKEAQRAAAAFTATHTPTHQ